MKKIIWIMALFILLIPATVSAATTQNKLPNTWTYAGEWINLHLLTYRTSSKVIVLDRLATNRANNVLTGYELGKTNQINNLLTRYGNLEKEINAILAQKKLTSYPELIDRLETSQIEQQKTLSEVRQNIDDQDLKTKLASVQENTVNEIKDNISITNDEQSTNDFVDKVVTVWRDPTNSIKEEEKATRVYAAGTTATGNDGNNGIIIDQGQAKITKDSSNNLKIEYAPGTGPSSVVGDNGKRVWKIQNSDGTIIESYSSASNVVIGGSGNSASNIVVNTVSGGTNGPANVVVGSGNNTGSVGVKVMGGLPQVKIAPMESSGPSEDPAQNTPKSLNSTNSIKELNNTNRQGNVVAPVEPLPQQ